MENRIKLGFGLNDFPDDTPAVWGARAIQKTHRGPKKIEYYLDFLGDRQDLQATNQGSRKALLALLNDARILEHLQECYADARKRGELAEDVVGTVTLFENRALTVKADTRASFGYVYVCAYLKPSTDVSHAVCSLDQDVSALLKQGKTLWSSQSPIPKVGDEVNVRMNDIGKSVVLGIDTSCDFVLLHIWPTNPPDWYKKQSKLGRSWNICSVFGADLDE